MSLVDFFTPIDLKKITPKKGYYTSHLGMKIDHYSVNFPSLDENKPDIALFGVLEDRQSIDNSGCALGPDYVRERLYQLNEGGYTVKIADLGNIRQGATVTDTYVAVKTVVNELIKSDIIPVIIGGGQDLTYAQYMAYEDLEQRVDVVTIDAFFDLDDDFAEQNMQTTSTSYLNRI